MLLHSSGLFWCDFRNRTTTTWACGKLQRVTLAAHCPSAAPPCQWWGRRKQIRKPYTLLSGKINKYVLCSKITLPAQKLNLLSVLSRFLINMVSEYLININNNWGNTFPSWKIIFLSSSLESDYKNEVEVGWGSQSYKLEQLQQKWVVPHLTLLFFNTVVNLPHFYPVSWYHALLPYLLSHSCMYQRPHAH